MEPLLVDATYEGGVLKPDQPLPLSEHQRVRISVASATPRMPDSDEPNGSSVPSSDPGDWTEQNNGRRCQLIDRQIQGTITAEEDAELDKLQQSFRRYLDSVAPLPLDGARRLHAELLRRHSTK